MRVQAPVADPPRLLLYDANMTAKPVQISMDTALLRRIDADPEVREKGRSAFVRSAVELYLTAKERKEIDAQIERGYAGQADVLLAESEDLIGAQAWPDD
jgi:metal-responsive CopG/Arc/MetJ family transcriptional regulator